MYTTQYLHKAGREGGLSKTCAQDRSCTKMVTNANVCTHGYIPPSLPPKQCKLVNLTPLRSVRHHNPCSDDTCPPTQKMITRFVIAAELKHRFHSHPIDQQSIQVFTSRTSHFKDTGVMPQFGCLARSTQALSSSTPSLRPRSPGSLTTFRGLHTLMSTACRLVPNQPGRDDIVDVRHGLQTLLPRDLHLSPSCKSSALWMPVEAPLGKTAREQATSVSRSTSTVGFRGNCRSLEP